ncbi:MAG: ribonuclease H-like domain-containing protein [candidate division Zixibacteria bacterium]|nr:ribonuclease H-like domain-containing protein [candidate division Zixibacteria bacterium]
MVAKPLPEAVAASTRYRRLADAVSGEVVTAPAGAYCQVTTTYPFGHRFGEISFDPPGPGASVQVASYTPLECEGETSVSDLLFVDTETTGLGGSGAVAFLIGCGSITPQGFEVRQYLLPDYSDEAAMLEQVLAELHESRTLVSYNGAAFDLNLIRDRFIVNRVAREVPCAGHFDLLHSARRLFRRRLNDCTLANVEREIFGHFRQNDIPGHLMPSIYFDWLQTDSTELIPAVLEHNRQDILSLYFLLLKVDQVFRTEGAVLDYAEDIYSLSRVYGRRKRPQNIITNYEALERSSPHPLTNEVIWFHSLAYKRQGDWSRAVGLWRQLVDSAGLEAYPASLELAMYFEHQAKDISQALDFSLKAQRLGPATRRQGQLLEKRLNRLREKLTFAGRR